MYFKIIISNLSQIELHHLLNMLEIEKIITVKIDLN